MRRTWFTALAAFGVVTVATLVVDVNRTDVLAQGQPAQQPAAQQGTPPPGPGNAAVGQLPGGRGRGRGRGAPVILGPPAGVTPLATDLFT